jgi:hypothetical protein
MGLTCSSRERSIPLATGLEQQATVADLVPAALDRFNQPFNLPAGEVLPAPLRQCSPPPAAALDPPFFRFCARLSFCREFNPCEAPETRMNRGGDLLCIYKRIHFVESGDGRGGFC